MAEITEDDRQRAEQLQDQLEVGRRGPAFQLRVLEKALAEQREQLTLVDLYEEGDAEVNYGSPEGIGDDFPSLIAYTLTLPSGHVFRLAPWQARGLIRELTAALGTDA